MNLYNSENSVNYKIWLPNIIEIPPPLTLQAGSPLEHYAIALVELQITTTCKWDTTHHN